MLGIIAGIQHGDDVAVKRCLDMLTCPARCEPVAMAAGSFALALKGLNQLLVPIPSTVINDIGSRDIRNTIH